MSILGGSKSELWVRAYHEGRLNDISCASTSLRVGNLWYLFITEKYHQIGKSWHDKIRPIIRVFPFYLVQVFSFFYIFLNFSGLWIIDITKSLPKQELVVPLTMTQYRLDLRWPQNDLETTHKWHEISEKFAWWQNRDEGSKTTSRIKYTIPISRSRSETHVWSKFRIWLI